MIKPEPILRDVFDGWVSGEGIFKYLAEATTLPWSEEEKVDNSVLDIAYFGNHSGSKFCSPLVKTFIGEDDVVPVEARETIAKIIISKYFSNWARLWETNIIAYSPITNYDMTETRKLAKSDSEAEAGGSVVTNTGTDTFEHGKKEEVSHGRTTDDTLYKFGINTDAENPKPSDKNSSIEGGSTVTENSGSDVDTKDLTTESTSNKNRVGAGEEEEETHRIGNIGVTTNQRLVQEERNLWMWNYFDQIFKDLDRELALMFHDPCRV